MGELRGRQLEPREIAELCYDAGWKDAKHLTIAVAVCLSESQGYDRAINWNYKKDSNGDPILDRTGNKIVASEDHGMWQINTSAHPSVSIEEAYNPELATAYAYQIYKRRSNTFNAWYGYFNGICFHDRYLMRATRGVGNFLGDWMLDQQKIKAPDWETELETPLLIMRDKRFR
jgi:hypothetical protein